ncbi:MAG TPA: transposase, partial [Longimicrobiaceae bacterium]|nr:transposase [Longimicrobiaceae bacterium]
YRPARPSPDRRTLLVLSPIDWPPFTARSAATPTATSATLRFLTALARLIPPPRIHRHRYHGVLAPNAALRERVTALARDATDILQPPNPTDLDSAYPAQNAVRSRWAQLLARIYEVLPLSCPDCGGQMRILAFLTDPFTVGSILRHVGLPASPPPLTPARSPPPGEPAYDADPLLDLDQTPAFDPTDPDPLPDYDFDQTLGA